MPSKHINLRLHEKFIKLLNNLKEKENLNDREVIEKALKSYYETYYKPIELKEQLKQLLNKHYKQSMTELLQIAEKLKVNTIDELDFD